MSRRVTHAPVGPQGRRSARGKAAGGVIADEHGINPTGTFCGDKDLQAKDHYTEVDKLIDSTGVVNKVAADTSVKTVKG